MIKDKFNYAAAIKKLNKWTAAYEENHPIVEDKEWDDLYFDVKFFEENTGIIFPDSPTQKIHYQVLNKLTKVTHNHPMLSLDKTKDLDEIKAFLGKSRFIAMAKMDGLTCSLHYVNGWLVSAETRGNGIEGEDVTHNAMVIPSIPKIISTDMWDVIIDGEIISTYDNFTKFNTEYKNPRNFASGSIRLLDSKECEKRGLTFVAWDMIKGAEGLESQTLFAKINYMYELGFTVVPCISGTGVETINLDVDNIKNVCQEKGYPIDGIVFKFNDIDEYESKGRTDHHFKGGMAYKFYDETYPTQLRSIQWTMGRTGVLTPVALFDPVDIEGTTVSRASLHNVSVLRDTLHTKDNKTGWINQKIQVFKANMIIPQLAGAEEDDDTEKMYLYMPNVCPICGGNISIHNDNGTNVLMCDNPACEGKLINRLDHFCGKKGLDIKGISKATLDKLIEWNWVTDFEDIFELAQHRDEWIKKPGFGDKSVDRILTSIQESTNTELWRIIAAAGIPLIGSRASKDLANYFKTWDAFRKAVNNCFDFTQLPDMGSATEEAILGYDYTLMDVIVDRYLTYDEVKEETTINSLEGKVFVITGKVHLFKNREEIKEKIESLGGKVTGSVTSKTNYLINNDINSTTAKNTKAKSLGIPIISEEEFVAMIK